MNREEAMNDGLLLGLDKNIKILRQQSKQLGQTRHKNPIMSQLAELLYKQDFIKFLVYALA